MEEKMCCYLCFFAALNILFLRRFMPICLIFHTCSVVSVKHQSCHCIMCLRCAGLTNQHPGQCFQLLTFVCVPLRSEKVDLQLPQVESAAQTPADVPPEPRPRFKERTITSLGAESSAGATFKKRKTENGKSRSLRQRETDE